MSAKLIATVATCSVLATTAGAQVKPNAEVYGGLYGQMVEVDVAQGDGLVPISDPDPSGVLWPAYCALLDPFGYVIIERPLYHDEWLYEGEMCWIDGRAGVAIY